MRAALATVLLVLSATPLLAQNRRLDSLRVADSTRRANMPCTPSDRLMGTLCGRQAQQTDTIFLDPGQAAVRGAPRRTDTVYVDVVPAVDTVYVDRATGRVIAGPDRAQPIASVDENRPGRKDGGTATLFGFLITGGGHMYAGEGGTGAILLLLGLGGGGLAIASADDCGFGDSCAGVSVGLAIAGASWLIGLIDAAPAARRQNIRNGYETPRRASIRLGGSNGRLAAGLSIPIGP